MPLLRTSLLFVLAASVACAGCGEFQSPYFPLADDTLEPAPHTDDIVFPVPEERVISCTIMSYPTALPVGARGDLLLEPTLAGWPYARFVVSDAPEDLQFVWGLEGVLPRGLSLDEHTGELQGVALELGARTVQLTAEAEAGGNTRYECAPQELTIRVHPLCTSDEDCQQGDLAADHLTCDTSVFADPVGGVCSHTTLKDEQCPARVDRFQVWLDGAEFIPPELIVQFAATVQAHGACTETRFSLDDGGHQGHCLFLLPDDPKLCPHDERPDVAELLRVAYRLPWDYPLPLHVGERYLFRFERSPSWGGSHLGDATFYVYEMDEESERGLSAGTRRERRLLFAGHTGRLLPHEVLGACQSEGVCPFVARARVAPTACLPVSTSSCGTRTPVALFLEDDQGDVDIVLAEESPSLLDVSKGDREERPSSPSKAPAFALHMGLSDSFVGDQAIGCLGEAEEVRLSFFVLPTSSCLSLKAVPAGGQTTATAPTRLAVRVENEFSPAGRPLVFLAQILEQPAVNRLFEPLEPRLAAGDTLDFLALVPGIYQYRVMPVDDLGTPSCGARETVRFAVEPRSRALLYLEASQTADAEIRLLIGPVEAPLDDFILPDASDAVARAEGLVPEWAHGDEGARSLARWHTPSVPRVPGAAIQSFSGGRPAEGRYRVVLYRPPEPGRPLSSSEELERPGLAWAPPSPVVASFRAVIERNLDEIVELSAPLPPCHLWQVGVLDVGPAAMRLEPSDRAPEGICGPVDLSLLLTP